MGTFSVDCVVHPYGSRDSSRTRKLLVDTGSENTWIAEAVLEEIGVTPEKKDLRFVMANGQVITREIGFAILRVGDHFTVDEVVFAKPGDLELLGARTLEGLSLTVDPRRKKLVSAGPHLAAPAYS